MSNTLNPSFPGLLNPVAELYVGQVYDAATTSDLLGWMGPEVKRVLDVGCGSGAYAARLRALGIEVHGVTLSEAEAELSRSKMAKVTVANVETWMPDYELECFDAMLFSHVLEHLIDPAAALKKMAGLLSAEGRLFVALPNIAYWKFRLGFLRGRFQYEDCGPMDWRHLRFFTYETAQHLLEQAGFKLIRVEPRGHLPLGFVRKSFPRAVRKLDALALHLFPNLFGYEILMCAEKIGAA